MRRRGPKRRLRLALALGGRLVLRHPLALLMIVIPAALMLGSLAGYAIGAAGGEPPYRAARLRAIAAELARIDGDYLLAAGDSHIERWPARRLCGLPLVNAGVSGATAESYGELLSRIVLPRKPLAVIVTIGTNDAQRKRLIGDDDARLRFEPALSQLLSALTHRTELVMLTGAPPLDPARAEGFSPDAAARIGTVAEAICRATPGCRFAAPFPSGLEMTDGVHFDDYAAAYRAIGPQLCASLVGKSGSVAAAASHAP
jgi:lysophospholipase L1-like esterase